MEINIEIIEPKQDKYFYDIKLSYQFKKEKYKHCLAVDYEQVYRNTKDVSSVSFDFFFIAATVYGIDRIVSRNLSDDGWSRILKASIPIINIDTLKPIEAKINSALSFLTGDYWEINFVKNTKSITTRDKFTIQEDLFSLDDISLFSGGMDSLIGIINYLECHKTKKLFLVSHYGHPWSVNTDQVNLFRDLDKFYSTRVKHIQCRVNIDKESSSLDLDVNFRSRSFLFITLGLVIANTLTSNPTLLMSENGSISLNFPLSKSRFSSCSTRTTHPTFLTRMNEIFGLCGIETPILNNYISCTKGDMLVNLKNQSKYLELINKSNSCAKGGHKVIWVRKGANHCGFCLPCLYRRAAFNRIGKDDATKYGIDVFNEKEIELNSENSKRNHDFRALLRSLNNNYTKDEISNILLYNGVSELNKIGDYVTTVIKTRNELKDFIKEKGTKKIKILAGIND